MNPDLNIYAGLPPRKAVVKCAVPSMIAMLMVLIYNLADTFFIGLTGDPLMVAAVSVATPIFLIFMCVGTLFGVGGTSAISRALGEGRRDYAKKVSAFCFWSCVGTGVLLMVLILVFMDKILAVIGTSESTYAYTKTYLTLVTFCAPFAIISNCFSNILRAEGQTTKAMMGTTMGNLLNVVLDGVFVLVFHMDIVGVAIATVIGNVAAALYYVFFYLRKQSKLSINIKYFTPKEGVFKGVMAIGIPASLSNILMSVSTVLLNAQMVQYGDLPVAAIGVTQKVVMISVMLLVGFGLGVQPLLGYYFGGKQYREFRETLRFSVFLAVVVGAVMTALSYLFSGALVGAFLQDAEAYQYGLTFVRINLVTGIVTGASFVLTNAIQAMGAAVPSLFLSVCRQGLIFIPTMFVLNRMVGIYGLASSQPVADVLFFFVSIIVYVVYSKKFFSHTTAIEINTPTGDILV